MDSTIIVALITGIVSAGGSLLGFVANERARRDKMEESHKKKLEEVTQTLQDTMTDMRTEYLKRIDDVEKAIAKSESMYHQTTSVIDLKIESLERAQNKHNNLIERMYKLEEATAVQTEQIKVANHRIDDLENKTS